MHKFPLVFLTMAVPLNELPPSPVCLVRALALLRCQALENAFQIGRLNSSSATHTLE